MKIRAATTDDAKDLAVLINMAGEHLPECQWRQMAKQGQTPLDVGARRAAREEGSFSYRNAMIAEIEGAVAGMTLSYRLADSCEAGDLDSYPATIRPLVELEAHAAGSWYVNAIATYEPYRGRGVASALMSLCEELAAKAQAARISLIVASKNERALALYLKTGYRQVASRPLVDYPGGPDGGDWLLMVKALN